MHRFVLMELLKCIIDEMLLTFELDRGNTTIYLP